MVTTQGITIPLWLWVRALNCFTNSMMFTPCGPRAVPTGGAGVAAPAGHWSFTIAWIFFAMLLLVTWARPSGLLPRIRAVAEPQHCHPAPEVRRYPTSAASTPEAVGRYTPPPPFTYSRTVVPPSVPAAGD